MKTVDRFWTWLARKLATPRFLAWARRYSASKPHFALVRDDGTVYMHRWWLLPRWMLEVDDDGVLCPKRWAPVGPRLQHIVDHDRDRRKHDHPRGYRTFVLQGWYDEEELDGRFATRIAGDTVRKDAKDFHRIAAVSDGGVWTLFTMYGEKQDWGFLVDDQKMHWKRYLGLPEDVRNG